MEIVFQHRGTAFLWDAAKARANLAKHGISFEEAVTVFDDPLLVTMDASRNEETRDAVIGFDGHARLLFVVFIEISDQGLRIISARRASSTEEMIYVE